MLRKKLALLIVAATLPAAYVQSGTVDLATLPLISGVANSVAPNIYFILDDSTSMNWDYMPDSVDDNDASNCFKNFGYNTIYYNPAVTYAVPKNSDGTNFSSTNTDWEKAKDNGFSSASGTTDLSASTSQTVTTTSTPVRLGNNPFTTSNGSRNVTVSQPGHGLASGARVTFTGAVRFNNVTLNGTYTISNVTANTYRIQAGNNANRNGTGGGNAVFETHSISTTIEVGDYGWYEYEADPTSPPSTCEGDGEYVWRWPSTDAEKLNYTNWYSYYRTRILMMKSATGRAFASVDDSFRVGYSAISEKGTGATKFLKIDRFEGTHKTTWYDKLYKAGCSAGTCYTPLRGALSKAGRMYAGKVADGQRRPGAVLLPAELHHPDHGRLLEHQLTRRPPVRPKTARTTPRRRRPGRRDRHRAALPRRGQVPEHAGRHRDVLLQVRPASGTVRTGGLQRKRASASTCRRTTCRRATRTPPSGST